MARLRATAVLTKAKRGQARGKADLSRSRVCPKCEAKKGQPCFNLVYTLYPRPMKTVHEERTHD